MTVHILPLNNPRQDIDYTDAVVSLVKRAQAANAAPHLYPQSRDFFERNLSGETINILALDGDSVVGYSALRKMNPWPNYLDPSHHSPEDCALMLFNLVDPAYRGQGIGKQLATARIQSAKSAGFRHLYVTTHPDNKPTIKLLNSLGFTLLAQKPMFTNQLMRNLMHLDTEDQALSKHASVGEISTM